MDFVTIARLAMKLLGNQDLLGRVKDLIPNADEALRVPAQPLPDMPPQPGYKQGSVKWLQHSLNQIDNAGLEVDGKYGPATRDAVSHYQQRHGDLEVDGWAGPLTVAAIVVDLEEGKRVQDEASGTA